MSASLRKIGDPRGLCPLSSNLPTTSPDTATPGLAPRPSAPEPISRYYIKEMKSNAWKVTSVGAAEQHMFIRYDYITLMLALIRGCRSPNKRKTTTKKGGKSVNVLKR